MAGLFNALSERDGAGGAVKDVFPPFRAESGLNPWGATRFGGC